MHYCACRWNGHVLIWTWQKKKECEREETEKEAQMENPHFVFQSFSVWGSYTIEACVVFEETEIDFGLVTTVQCSHSAIFSLTLTPQYPILLSPQPSVSEPWRPTPRLFNSIASSRSVTLPPMLPEKLFANTSGRTSTFFTNMISVGYLFSFSFLSL